jgi:transposase, IS30 family
MPRRSRDHKRRLETNPELCRLVSELLARRWRARGCHQQISRHLRANNPYDRSIWLCHESIYQPGSTLLRPSKVAVPSRSPLCTGRDHRRAQQHGQRRRPRFAQPILTVHERPFDPTDRSQAGHWEGDLIIGKNQGSAIGTLIERQTRTIHLLYLPDRDVDALRDAITAHG